MKRILLLLSVLFTCWQINAQYCTTVIPTGCAAFSDTIDDFTIPAAGFSHLASGCSANNYGDFTSDAALQIDLAQATPYDFTITHGAGGQWVKIWIDFNVDQVFDASEVVFASTAGGAPTIGSFTIPPSATIGLTRMRVITIFGQEPSDPCTPMGTWGETHDYTVNILPPPPCPDPTDVASVNVFFDSIEASWTAVGNATDGYLWEVYAAGDDPAVDTAVSTGTFPAGSTQGIADGLTPETDYEFYLAADCGATDGVSGFAPSVSFTTSPTCSLPSTFDVGSILPDSAELSWSSIPNATNGYNWAVFNAGDDPATATPVSSGTAPGADTFVVVTGLTDNTSYDAYITTDCGTDGLSDQSPALTFLTPCTALVAPITENFDGSSWVSGTGFGNTGSQIDNCWSRNPVDPDFFWGTRTGATGSTATGPDSANSGVNYIFTEGSNGVTGDEALLESPLIDLSSLTVPALTFWYHMAGADMGALSVDVDAGSGYDLDVFTISGVQQANTSDSFTEQITDLSAYTGQTVRIRFRGTKGGGFASDMAIDDFRVDEAPTCFKPENLSVIDVFFDSIEVSWNPPASGASDGYVWEVYAAGDDPAVDTPVSTGAFPAGSTQGIADGLMPEMDYDIYLASDCGATDGISEFTNAITFTTTELCSLPSSFSFTNLLPDSVELTWTSIPNAASGYNWAVFNEGDDPATATAVASGTAASADTSVVATGLTDNTNYEAYITTDCGADGTSGQSTALAFTTPCTVFVAPYFNNFENVTPTTTFTGDDCWSESSAGTFAWDVSGAGTPSTGTGPNSAFSGSNFLFTEATSGTLGVEALLVSPLVDLSGLTDPALSFWYHMFGADMGDLVIDVNSGSGYDLAVATITGQQQANQTDSWLQQFVDLSAYSGQTVTIRFRGVRGDGFTSDMSIDDVAVDEAPTCFSPSNISITNITESSADVSWDEVANALNGYDWELYLAGEDPTTATPTQSGNVPFGTTTLNLTTLVDGTGFDFYILSNCDTNGLSTEIGPLNFTTLFLPPANDDICDAIPLTVGVIPPGDTYTNFAATAEPNEPVASCFNGGINGSVWFTFVAPASGEVEVSTDIAGGTLTDSEVAVYDEPTDCTDYSTLGSELGCDQDGGVVVGFSSIVNLTGLIPGTTYYVQVDIWGTAAPGSFGISVLDTNPPCPNPENVTFVSSTTTTADFTWDDVVEETDGYNWYVFDAGADVIADTPVASGSLGADVTAVTATGLLASSTYDFYVEANCGTALGNSILSDVVTFNTLCEAFPTPYFEDFANFTVTTTFVEDGCWTEASPGGFAWDVESGQTPSTGTGPDGAEFGSNYLFTESSSGALGDEAIVLTPLVDLTNLTAPALSFWYHMFGADMGTLHVDVDDGTNLDLSVFSISGEQQTSLADAWVEQFVDLSAYVGQTIQVRFRVERGDGFTSDVALDGVRFDEAPPCLKPTGLALVEVFFDTAEVTWSGVGNATTGYNWAVFNAGDDPSSDTPVSTGTFPAGSTQGIVTGLTPETDYDVYIESDCGADGTSGFANPISITTTPLCSVPSTFDVINLLPDSAELTWTAIPNAAGYNWAVFIAGDDPATATPVAAGTSPSTDTSVVVTGLTDNTSYDAYITTDCGGDGLSVQSSAVTFLTPCTIFATPYFEDFETFTPSTSFDFAQCWTEVSPGAFDWNISNTDTPSFDTGPNQAFSGTNFLYTEASSGAAGDEALFVSPLIDLSSLSAPALSFWYHMFGADMGTLNVDIDAGSGYDLAVFSLSGPQQANQVDPWIEQFVDLSAYAGQTVQIRFRGERGSSFESDMSIDDVRVDEAPSCLTPTGLTVTNIDINSIDISWSPVGNATTGYNWLVFAAGADPDVDTPLFTGSVGSGVTSTTITGLNAATVYDVYIQSDCGAVDGTSNLSPEVTFQTLCDTVPAPYFNNFENFTATTTLVEQECWTEISTGTFSWDVSDDDTVSGGTGPNQAFSGTNFIFTEASSGTLGDEALLESPSVDLSPLTVPALSFWYHMFGGDMGTLRVDVDAGSGYDLDVFTLTGQQQANQADDWIQIFVDLSAYAGQTVTVRLRGERGDGFESDISIDDFRIDEAPTCFDPNSLEVLSVTDTSANLNWVAGSSETIFDVEVVLAGTTPTGVPTFEDVTLPFTATGLTAETDYDFYVRADCGAGDVSNWVGPVSFTTVFTPTTVVVNAPAINNTYCYGNDEVKEWLFVSSDGVTPVELQFTAGEIENDPDSSDRCRIFDGFDINAPVLYDTDIDGTDMTGVQLVANSGAAYIYLESDNFESCQGGLANLVPLDFDVFAGTVSTVAFSNTNFNFYPNPVRSILNIESANPISSIQVYDMLGKVVYDKNFDASNLDVNLQELSSGTYLMKVSIGDFYETFRIIKE